MLVESDNGLSILFIESGTWGGGSFESLYHHLRVLDKKKFKPVVVFISETHYAKTIRKMGIPVYIFTDYLQSKHMHNSLRFILHKLTRLIECYLPCIYLTHIRIIKAPLINNICRIVKKHRIDIIHLNTQIQRDLFGVFAARKTNRPCISHLRSDRSGDFNQKRAGFCNQYVSCYIANSKKIKEYWVDIGVDNNKTKIIYNGIPEESVKPLDIRKKWNINARVNNIIGCVGRLAWAKGHIFLLKSFKLLTESNADNALLIIGHGDLREELEKEVRDMGLEKNVYFTGYQLNIKEIIADLDLIVVPSKEEPFGRVVIESMQVGTPVIGTNVGGIPEIIEDRVNGLLVEYNDHRGLSEAMKRFIADKKLREKVIENGYQTVRKRFSIERYASELEQVYKNVYFKS